ncbi:unnamed protein product, partial [Sphacelaria rigidula]
MSKSAHRGVSSGDASSRLTRGPAFGSDTTRPVGTGRQSPADMMDVSEPPSDPGFVFQTRQQEVPTPTTQSAPLPAATARPTPPVAAASPGAASSFVFGPTPSKSVANGAAPAAPTQSPFGSPPPLSTATPVRFEFSGGVRPVQPTSPEQKPPAGESSSRPGILPPAFSFGPKKAGWTPTPRPPASPNRKGAMFATGAPPTDQRENTRKTRGRRGQRGRPTSGSSPTPPPPPGRRDWHVNADSMKGGMGNSTGAVGANGFWGPWAGTFKSG